jgi:hypothetical protein
METREHKPISCLLRLKIELERHYNCYLTYTEYREHLEKYGLNCDMQYDKNTMLKQILNATISVLEYLPISKYTTQMSEYSIEKMHDKIGKLKNSILNLEEWNGQKPIIVSSLDLAQQIIDKGFLYCLIGVSKHNRNPTKKVWFFEPNSIISGIVQDYGEQAKQHYYDRDMSCKNDDQDKENEY